ncbi:hypothetical protein O181_034156 [Austropuccinia psidii MF-1]|uniref:Uncharacterized protein n=1 Tax=Austropuccinia psidii MF-1 TaxID=1389203 RepID=A0A9Q3H7R4_9BASI|nr:hypothetical protein [Austropuccinia psidii MF-1]
MSRLHQDNINCHMCHMSMSLKAQTHFNTICKVWVITPHGERKQFGMLIFVHEKTSSPPPDHLTPLPCLLSCMNWLPHHHLIHSDPLECLSALTPPYASSDPPLTILMLV